MRYWFVGGLPVSWALSVARPTIKVNRSDGGGVNALLSPTTDRFTLLAHFALIGTLIGRAGQRCALRLGKPNLLWARVRCGLPIHGPLHHLAHSLKPPGGAAQPALAAIDTLPPAPVSKTQFRFAIIHVFPFVFAPIVAGQVGQMLSNLKLF